MTDARRPSGRSAHDIAYWLEVAEADAARDLMQASAATVGPALGPGIDDAGDWVAFWLTALDVGFFNRCVGLGISRAAAALLTTETGEETADDPNPSFRNMLRAGFRLGYLRQNWLQPESEESHHP